MVGHLPLRIGLQHFLQNVLGAPAHLPPKLFYTEEVTSPVYANLRECLRRMIVWT